MPTKGNKRQTIRFPPQEESEMSVTIKRRNVHTINEPWDTSAFVRKAVAEKIAHMERSRRPRPGRTKGKSTVPMTPTQSLQFITEYMRRERETIPTLLMCLEGIRVNVTDPDSLSHLQAVIVGINSMDANIADVLVDLAGIVVATNDKTGYNPPPVVQLDPGPQDQGE